MIKTFLVIFDCFLYLKKNDTLFAWNLKIKIKKIFYL